MLYDSPDKQKKPEHTVDNAVYGMAEKMPESWNVSDTLWGNKEDVFSSEVSIPGNGLPKPVDFFSLWTGDSGSRRVST